MYTEERKHHLAALEKMGLKPGKWPALRALEKQARLATTNYCNTYDIEVMDKAEAEITAKVAKLFGGKAPDGFFVNLDARGYALKVQTKNVVPGLQTDWGGYGLLAPQ